MVSEPFVSDLPIAYLRERSWVVVGWTRTLPPGRWISLGPEVAQGGREWELTWGQDFPEPQLSWEREKVTSLGMMGYLNYTQEFLWKAMEAKAALSDFSWSSKGKER